MARSTRRGNDDPTDVYPSGVWHGPADKFDLYELCVQSPPAMVRFLDAVHGDEPRVLREDFCGGGALCRAWVRTPERTQEAAPEAQVHAPEPETAESPDDGVHRVFLNVDVIGAVRPNLSARPRPTGCTAIGVDLDAVPLRRLRGRPNIRAVQADVMTCSNKADVIAALNFPLGYLHNRESLVKYLHTSRKRLNASGVFVADVYGGESAFSPCVKTAMVTAPHGPRVRYEWEQREADALTGRVVNAIHFVVRDAKGTTRLDDAFVYNWRLWSLPELREAYAEAGFTSVEVYDQEAGAIDHLGNLHVRPIEHGSELGDDWVAYVVGRR